MNGKLRWIPVKNGSGEVIPPYAAMEPFSLSREDNGVSFVVMKPYKNDSASALLNGGMAIPIGGYGFGTYGWPTIAKYSGAVAANQDSIGTSAGLWELCPGYEGFIVWGQRDDDTYVVQRDVTCRSAVAGGYYYPGGMACHCCGCSRFICDDPTCATAPTSLTVTVSFPCLGTRTLTINQFCPANNDGTNGCRAMSEPGTERFHYRYEGSYGSFIGIGDTTVIINNRCYGPPYNLIVQNYEYLGVNLMCVDCGDVEGDMNGCAAGGIGTHRSKWHAWVIWAKQVGSSEYQMNYYGPVTLLNCSPLSFTKTAYGAICDEDGSGHFLCASTGSGLPPERTRCDDGCFTTPFTACLGGDMQLDIDE